MNDKRPDPVRRRLLRLMTDTNLPDLAAHGDPLSTRAYDGGPKLFARTLNIQTSLLHPRASLL